MRRPSAGRIGAAGASEATDGARRFDYPTRGVFAVIGTGTGEREYLCHCTV
jgi:hypothetical protein